MIAPTLLLALLLVPQAPAGSAAAPSAGTSVVLDTTQGRIRIALDKRAAPKTVENFLRYVREHHYDGTVFHRVIPGFMIQGGGMDAQLKEKETHEPVANEAKNGLHNVRGTIAMARTSDPDSATSQFFINVVDNSSKLDAGAGAGPDGYAVFGQVTEGLDVVDKIAAVPTTTKYPYENVPATPVLIRTAKAVGGVVTNAALPKPAPPSPAPRKPVAHKPAAKPAPRPTGAKPAAKAPVKRPAPKPSPKP
jgi:peptidyl-prolyl cis-trans isomerase A (cyclophilin A)